MEELLEALTNNNPMEVILRKRLDSLKEAYDLLLEENAILLQRLNLLKPVIVESLATKNTRISAKKRERPLENNTLQVNKKARVYC